MSDFGSNGRKETVAENYYEKCRPFGRAHSQRYPQVEIPSEGDFVEGEYRERELQGNVNTEVLEADC